MTEKAISPAKDLRIGFFITGAFFLFNPFITIVDFLPDFIGALLFVLALYKLRDMSDHMESARTGFLRFFWISLSRIPAFLIMFWVSHNFSAERSIILVFTFCYAVLETILLAFCFNSLFDGFIYVGERNEGTAIFRTVLTKRVNGEYAFAPVKVEKYNKNVGNKRKRRKKIRGLGNSLFADTGHNLRQGVKFPNTFSLHNSFRTKCQFWIFKML